MVIRLVVKEEKEYVATGKACWLSEDGVILRDSFARLKHNVEYNNGHPHNRLEASRQVVRI